jgi:CubicO group peptidase (beta-lactamase class C family)
MRKLLLILAFLIFAAKVSAQSPEQEFYRFFDAIEKDTLFNGNVLIAHKGKPVYQRSMGFADFATMRKLDANSIFELASVSKQFTAMAIMILEQEGKLSIQDTLRKFIQSCHIMASRSATCSITRQDFRITCEV